MISGIFVAVLPQPLVTAERISQAELKALTGGWVEWFNAGNPVEPAR